MENLQWQERPFFTDDEVEAGISSMHVLQLDKITFFLARRYWDNAGNDEGWLTVDSRRPISDANVLRSHRLSE